jgi:hypothetical protein
MTGYRDPSLKELRECYKDFTSQYGKRPPEEIIRKVIQEHEEDTNREVELTPALIRQLSENLSGNSNKDGVLVATFLTGLIQLSPHTDFTIDLRSLNEKGITPDYVGCKLNRKKLTIIGNVGIGAVCGVEDSHIEIWGSAKESAATQTEKSLIEIRGNVGVGTGTHAKSCYIKIEGDAGNYTVMGAENCQIEIGGDAGKNLAAYAKNCRIEIKGKIKGLADDIGEGTEIYRWNQWKNDWDKIYPKLISPLNFRSILDRILGRYQ